MSRHAATVLYVARHLAPGATALVLAVLVLIVVIVLAPSGGSVI